VLAALEGVLRLHLAGATLPFDQLWADPASHRERLDRVAVELAARLPAAAAALRIVEADAFLGGGSAPEAPIRGAALAIAGGGDALLAALRLGEPAVVGYLRHGQLVLDLRTVAPEDDDALLAALVRAWAVAGPAAAGGD
jgi:L-seryl-tRNA(Ser) seleniumtransferase